MNRAEEPDPILTLAGAAWEQIRSVEVEAPAKAGCGDKPWEQQSSSRQPECTQSVKAQSSEVLTGARLGRSGLTRQRVSTRLKLRTTGSEVSRTLALGATVFLAAA